MTKAAPGEERLKSTKLGNHDQTINSITQTSRIVLPSAVDTHRLLGPIFA